MKRILSLLLLLLFVLSAFVSCSGGEKPKTKTYYEFFDTVCTVSIYSVTEKDAKEHFMAAEDMLWRYNSLFDIYKSFSGIVNLKDLNDAAAEQPISVAPEIRELLLFGKEMYTLTGGEVNIAMGAVLSLWHDAREAANTESAHIPSAEELAAANLHTNIDDLVIDEAANTVYFRDPEMKIDVGAVAKGFVTDRVAELLVSRGVTSATLNFGGNIKVIGGKPSGAPFVAGITNPDKSKNDFAARVNLRDISLVTSGDYERFFTYGENNYHHIIDKDTLMPSKYFSSVSILHESAAVADALSTALFSMDYETGRLLADSVEAEALWIKSDGTQYKTDGFSTLISK